MIKITLFGSTGLIGNEILRILENDDAFENINIVCFGGGPISNEENELILELGIENKKIIVMGDLNCLPDSKPINTLKSKLEDSHDISIREPYGPIGTSNGFNLDKVIKNRIDYIFTKNIKVIDHRIIDDRRENNLFISDHLPVITKMIN